MKPIRKKHIVLLATLFMIACAHSQAQQLQYALKPGTTYWRISNYSEGLAKVEVGTDSVGFINTSGKLVFINKCVN